LNSSLSIHGDDADTALLLARLTQRGWATSGELQALFGKSQATVSRLLGALAPRLLVLGAGRRTRYALPQPILGHAATQALHWVHEDGRIEPWGTLSFVAGQRVHIAAAGIDSHANGALPWLLSPLRGEGFIGRLQAQRFAAQGLDRDPSRWPVEHQLFAALHTPDAPGALMLGEPRADEPAPQAIDYDTLADNVASTLPAGSSAGGEQAKFLTRRADDGAAVLVKFTPPRGTPFGERWHDLLHAEALALSVLAAHGVEVAAARMVQTPRRTCLESLRFDRVGGAARAGRRHVVPLWAAHEAFVAGPRRNWAATCEALAAQRRLPPHAAAQARALQHFGRLIGNSDMHFGNLSLFVAPADAARGRFTLTPVYDMLPMRWRPDAATGALDLLPFTPEPVDLQSAAQAPAQAFWQRAAQHAPLSPGFRALAREMLARVR
jgi:HipA-like C-terminal domain